MHNLDVVRCFVCCLHCGNCRLLAAGDARISRSSSSRRWAFAMIQQSSMSYNYNVSFIAWWPVSLVCRAHDNLWECSDQLCELPRGRLMAIFYICEEQAIVYTNWWINHKFGNGARCSGSGMTGIHHNFFVFAWRPLHHYILLHVHYKQSVGVYNMLFRMAHINLQVSSIENTAISYFYLGWYRSIFRTFAHPNGFNVHIHDRIDYSSLLALIVLSFGIWGMRHEAGGFARSISISR